MSLVAYRPRRSFVPSLFNDDFVRTFFNDDISTMNRRATKWVPSVNVNESENAFTLEFAVPGMKKEDLKVNVEKNVLTVSYNHEENKDNSAEAKAHLREFVRRSFTRSFQLPETVNADAVTATYTDGILNVTLPKHEQVKPVARQIQISDARSNEPTPTISLDETAKSKKN